MKNQTYEKIANIILEQLNAGVMPWRKGWKAPAGTAQNGITKNEYKGVNRYLIFVSMCRGYESNDWLTFNQMQKKGLNFKKDNDGKCLASGAGCPVVYFKQYDRKTKKPFTQATVKDMTDEERAEYFKENVRNVAKSFTVFNGSLIDGYEESKAADVLGDYDPTQENEQAERLLTEWGKIVPIYYGGNSAYYVPQKDEIHLPERKHFLNVAEFYSTAFHEIAHSTGTDERLQRGKGNVFGSTEYAFEELIAEFSSAFLRAELGICGELTEDVNNSASYIDSWRQAIKENPDSLANAIKKVEESANYILERTA